MGCKWYARRMVNRLRFGVGRQVQAGMGRQGIHQAWAGKAYRHGQARHTCMDRQGIQAWTGKAYMLG
eukprot:scaffold280983_cov71-Attheya_sp.AAC.6